MNLDESVKKFVNTLTVKGEKPIHQLEPAQARKVLEDIQSNYPVVTQPALIETILIGTISVTIVRPGDYRGGILPAIIYCHGGGWILGSFSTHQRLCVELANCVRAVVVFVNYSRSPEMVFPEAIIQIYTVARYIYENGLNMLIDRDRMVIAGDSVGGNMATVVALHAVELGHIRFIHQCLFYPVTDSSFYTGSYQQFADGPWLTRKAMQWFWDALPSES
jgi:acetyl esterase